MKLLANINSNCDFKTILTPHCGFEKRKRTVLKDPEFMAILLSRHFSSHLGCAKLFHSNYHGSRRIISCLGTVMFRGMGQVVMGSFQLTIFPRS